MDIDNINIMTRKGTRWKPLPANWVKLNFNGAVRKEESVGGGIVRDCKGRILLAYAGPLGKVSNNVVELMALYWDLKFVLSVGWQDVQVEGDSKVIIEIVKGNMQEGWTIKSIINDIKNLLATINRFDLNHIFWEGNSMADGMTVVDLKLEGLRGWRNLNALPNLVRELVNKEINNDESLLVTLYNVIWLP